MFATLTRWFLAPSARPASLRRRSITPRLEPLDPRDLPAAGIRASMGKLIIEGTNQPDVVNVAIVDDQVQVDFNGSTSAFNAASIKSISFRGRGGNDAFTNNTGIVAVAWGGDGDDVLRGGSANDILRGDRGDDHLFGNAGDDRLVGGAGNDDVNGDSDNDDLRGGLGNDRLSGGMGDDRLSGDDGDDSLSGDDGRDHIRGGRGRDDSDRDEDDSFDDSEKGKPANGSPPSVITENESNNEKRLADRFALDANGLATLLGTSVNKKDKDYFVFTAQQSGTIHVQVLATNGVFAQLEVENAAGRDLLETEPNHGINSGSFDVTAGGVYFIRLRAKDNVSAGYQVNLSL